MGDEMKPRGIAARMASVLKGLGAVKKTGKKTHFKYDYHSIDDITGAVRSALGEEGVAVATTIDHHDIQDAGRGKMATVILTVTFRCSETGEEMVSQGIGQGEDKADKAFLKAQTAAFKYAIRHTFLISEGGHDPDEDGEQEARSQERAPVPHKKREPKKPGEILAGLDAACTEATDAQTSSAFLTHWAKAVADEGASSELLDVIMTVPQKAEAMRRKLDGFNPRQRAEYIRKVLADKPQASQHSG